MKKKGVRNKSVVVHQKTAEKLRGFFVVVREVEPRGVSTARSVASSRALAKNTALWCFLNASRPSSLLFSPLFPNRHGDLGQIFFFVCAVDGRAFEPNQAQGTDRFDISCFAVIH